MIENKNLDDFLPNKNATYSRRFKNKNSRTSISKEDVIECIKNVMDPEIPVNIYDLGLIYTIEITEDNDVSIIMSLTAPGCPVAGEMPGWVEDAINGTGGVRQVSVDLIWEPPWGMDMMSDEARLELGFM